MPIKERRTVCNQMDIHGPVCNAAVGVFKQPETEQLKSMLGEHLLHKFIIGDGDKNEILNIYSRAFDVDTQQDIRLIILTPSGAGNEKDLFFVKNTAQQYIDNESLLLGGVINDRIVLITTLTEQNKLTALLDEIRNAVRQNCGCSLLAVYSRIEPLSEVRAVFERMNICMRYSFYAESNGTLYESDIIINDRSNTVRPQYGTIEHSVKSGDMDKVEKLLDSFFEELRRALPSPDDARKYCLNLYISLIRCCNTDTIERYISGIMPLQELKFLYDIENFVREKAMEITEYNAPECKKIYSALVRDTIDIIEQNIENENLSLRWLAGTILYTNVDYLGKLFKKETGKNFSHYVMEKRMEMAKNLILEGKKDRIYEVAENVGYGSNSQYFSQVFKKYTGVSPLEYKEFARLTREKKKM